MPPMAFPSMLVPISCAYPIGLAPPVPAAVAVVPPAVAAIGPPAAATASCWPAFLPMFSQCQNAGAGGFLPIGGGGGWLPLLLFGLLLLLLLFLCLCCLPWLFWLWMRRSRRPLWPMRKRQRVSGCGQPLEKNFSLKLLSFVFFFVFHFVFKNLLNFPIKQVHPPSPAINGPSQPSRGRLPRIFTVDDWTQTNNASAVPLPPPPPSPAVDYTTTTDNMERRQHQRVGTAQWHTEMPLSPPQPQTWFWSREVEETEEREEEWLEEEEEEEEHQREYRHETDNSRRGGGGGKRKYVEFLDQAQNRTGDGYHYGTGENMYKEAKKNAKNLQLFICQKIGGIDQMAATASEANTTSTITVGPASARNRWPSPFHHTMAMCRRPRNSRLKIECAGVPCHPTEHTFTSWSTNGRRRRRAAAAVSNNNINRAISKKRSNLVPPIIKGNDGTTTTTAQRQQQVVFGLRFGGRGQIPI